jgi:cell fate regulator YaaT (PSP1 superfamily)
MSDVVKIRLRNIDRIIYCLTGDLKDLGPGRQVVVSDQGSLDYGTVFSFPEKMRCTDGTITKKVTRFLTDTDKLQIEENFKMVHNAFQTCKTKIEELKMDMKLIYAEYSLDRTYLTFYFISDKRVDFRELVRDLSPMFKARVELRQVGVRDEAMVCGGFGKCGRELCCATFLKDIESITMKMARDQNLPLNPSRISGMCGRLMCCLGYEYNVYCEKLKGLPRVGDTVKTEHGQGRVVQLNILKRTVTVSLKDERQIEVVYK